MDTFDISTLLQRERFYHDTQDWNEIRKCWINDDSKTLIETTYHQGSIHDYLTFITSNEAPARILRHHHTVQRVNLIKATFNDEHTRAVAQAYVHGTLRMEYMHDGIDLEWTHLAICRLVKIGEEWKLVAWYTVHLRDSFQCVVAANAHKGMGSMSPKEKYRPGYKCWTGFLRKRVLIEPRDDLLGLDNWGKVKEVQEGCDRWLLEGDVIS